MSHYCKQPLLESEAIVNIGAIKRNLVKSNTEWCEFLMEGFKREDLRFIWPELELKIAAINEEEDEVYYKVIANNFIEFIKTIPLNDLLKPIKDPVSVSYYVIDA
jgi:hypothetical protein